MTWEEYEALFMQGLIAVLIIFMFFIVFDLARKTKAGKLGSFVLFGALCLGVIAYIIKAVVVDSFGGY
ncbi:DUF2788 domain-containing protein [Zooshikella marina]|uniref:DUF2788 domain-containing protein n=1 Tax=Zooshikella ganghwensis TaxID=202772 RepID=UPI001BB017CF|nr:DUF2788 domain-containing protein [Zooshikella ganghwensis]MBU2705520.1 DUF2788 domain-containing protein [Zooshikella ganghwensis]